MVALLRNVNTVDIMKNPFFSLKQGHSIDYSEKKYYLGVGVQGSESSSDNEWHGTEP